MAQLACLTMIYKEYPIEKAMERISEAGYKNVVIWNRHDGQDLFDDERAVERVRKALQQYNLTPVMLFSHSQFKHDEPIEKAHQQIDFAHALNIPEINILTFWGYHEFPNKPIVGEEYERLDRKCVAHLKAIAPYALERDITISIKPHTANTATGIEIHELLGKIGSPAYKASYDPGNTRHYEGVIPEDDMKHVLSEMASLIAKDQRGERFKGSFPLPGEGDVDFANLFTQLKSVNFDGPVVIEKVDDIGENLTMEQFDVRIRKARMNMERLLAEAGVNLR